MKRCLFLIVSIILILGLFVGIVSNVNVNSLDCKNENEKENVLAEAERVDNFLNFHIIANSDSDYDQKVKILVKTKAERYVFKLVEDITDYDMMVQTINANLGKITDIANAVLKENGFDYVAKSKIIKREYNNAMFSNQNIDGMFDALVVELGNAEGHNWWGLIYPKYCNINTESNCDIKSNQKKYKEDDTNSKNKATFKSWFKEILDKLK